MAAAEQLITANLDIWSSAVKTKSAAGRGKSNKLELYGIKKLRELILELAVRGLLVPQDPNDEPASELLKRIAAEKAKLVKDGKIKQPKALPPIGEDEKLYELPKGWEWCHLGDVTEIIRGITFPASEKSKVPEEGRVACLRTTNVQDKLEWEDLLFIREQFVKREDQYVCKNDIVMSMANSRELVGKIAIVSAAPELKTSFGGFLGVIRPIALDAYFVMSLFRVPTNRDRLIGSASQTTNIANISLGKLNPMVFSIPPLAEQHRIVAKVDELMALCDQLEQQQETSITAHQTLVQTLLDTLTTTSERDDFTAAWARIADHFDALFTTECSIDQLKQTILQLAVMGKLVPQDTNDEPASELLKKIAAEKAKLVNDGKIKKQKALPEIDEDEKPFELPEGWAWVKCNDICYKITDGEHATPHRTSKGHYLLSARNVTNEGIVLHDVDFVPADEFIRIRKRCDPNIGDILISCSGSVGRVALVDRDNAYSMVRSAAMIRPDPKNLLKEYLALMLQSPYLQEQMLKRSKQTAQANLFLGAISNLVAVIPPLTEQYRIAAKVDELLALCDVMKTHIKTAQTTQLQLADAVAAFGLE